MALDPVEQVDPIMEESWKYAEANKRYQVLGDCVTLVEAYKRRISRNGANQSAKDGYERAFDEEDAALKVLRGMMIEQRTIADAAMQRIAEIRRNQP
jgi:hypothetical protein